MDERNADWLIAMISTRGVVNSECELDLLFHIIDIATQIPDSLSIFALEQIRLAIRDKVGAWAELRASNRAELEKSDVLLITRVMGAIARSRGSQLTVRERRMLDEIGVLNGFTVYHAAAA